MPVRRKVVLLEEEFARGQAFTTTPGGDIFGLTAFDTSAAGTPTYLGISSDAGEVKLLCDNTSEAQVITLYQNDVLPFRLSQLVAVEFNIQVAGVDSVTTLTAGVGTARNSTPSSTSKYAWFRMNGATSTSAVVLGTTDGTTTKGGTAGTIATGVTLAAAYKRCLIDFSYGLADLRFFIDGARVASGTTFDISASPTSQVQLILQIQKASGTGVPSVSCDYIGVMHRTAA